MDVFKGIKLRYTSDDLENELSHRSIRMIKGFIILLITILLSMASVYFSYNWTLSNINISHDSILKFKIEKNGTTLQNLARRFIPDLNTKNGVKLIMKENKFDKENKVLLKGDIILIPTNGNKGLLTTELRD